MQNTLPRSNVEVDHEQLSSSETLISKIVLQSQLCQDLVPEVRGADIFKCVNC